MGLLLAHDIGTGGDKAALITAEGRVQASTFEGYPTSYPRPQWAEQDPEHWWKAVVTSTRRLLQQSKVPPDEIMGVTFSYQMLGIVPVDEGGKPLRPAIIWLDGRGVEEAKQVMRMFGGPAVFAALFGVAITGKDVIPKLLWLKKHEAELYGQTAAFLDVDGYLLRRATGRWVYEWSGASSTGLFNLKTKVWDTTLMRIFGLQPAKFPELVGSTQTVGGLSQQAAAECGLLQGTPVLAGAGDAPLAAVGSGAVGGGEGHISLGTSGWIGVISTRRVTGRRGIATIQAADGGKLFLIGETETAGACVEWAAQELYGSPPGPEVFDRMEADVKATEPGARGLIFTPWMYGERCPVADECVRSAFVNLCRTHTRAHMARAIYEGVAYNLRWMLDSIAELYGIRPDPLRIIGGGAKSNTWLQIIADVCQRTIESVSHPQQAAAVGAGLTAAVGLGLYPSFDALKALVPAEHVFPPDASWRDQYQQLYSAYKGVYPSLRKMYHTLNTRALVLGD